MAYCTCGTQLPDDARFCHRCGKPQRDEDADAAPPPVSERPPEAARPPVNFANRTAVRAGLVCASVSAFLFSLPFVSLGCCLWFPAAGFLAAFLYARRAGLTLSVPEGARMGWITGLLTFVIWMVFHAVTLALAPKGAIQESAQKWMQRLSSGDEATRRLLEFLTTTPAGLALMVVNSVILSFVLAITLTVAGGALGAKVMEKD